MNVWHLNYRSVDIEHNSHRNGPFVKMANIKIEPPDFLLVVNVTWAMIQTNRTAVGGKVKAVAGFVVFPLFDVFFLLDIIVTLV